MNQLNINIVKQGRKRPLDISKRMIERRREKCRRRYREGEILKGIERVKGAQSKPNPSANAFPKLCEWFSGQFLLKGRVTRTVLFKRKILVKSPDPGNKAQRKVEYKNYHAITEEKLLQKIIRRN